MDFSYTKKNMLHTSCTNLADSLRFPRCSHFYFMTGFVENEGLWKNDLNHISLAFGCTVNYCASFLSSLFNLPCRKHYLSGWRYTVDPASCRGRCRRRPGPAPPARRCPRRPGILSWRWCPRSYSNRWPERARKEEGVRLKHCPTEHFKIRRSSNFMKFRMSYDGFRSSQIVKVPVGWVVRPRLPYISASSNARR